jgi:2,4-dienoyl-CoA reductase-like NADH-dependent reductase (Old Yellow Enzyme family)
MKTLFDRTCIGPLRLKNRLVRSATWEAMAREDGRPTPRLVRVYEELARGGAGLIITGATTFAPDATHPPRMLAINDDTYIPPLRELTETVHKSGVPVIMQLVHPGRDGAMWNCTDASRDDIRSIVRGFGEAAARAQAAGFDGVEVHAAHGYFQSQFMNAKKNHRTDEYGGTVENQARFLLEIVAEIRKCTGKDYPVLVKINCSDFEDEDGVWEACRYTCRKLAEAGVAAIEVSGGVSGEPLPPPGHPYEESVFRDYAAMIADETGIPVILVGLNRNPALLHDLLNTTRIGYFAFSRPFLRQPDLARFWKKNSEMPALCTSCDACRNQPDGNTCPFGEDPVRNTCTLE